MSSWLESLKNLVRNGQPRFQHRSESDSLDPVMTTELQRQELWEQLKTVPSVEALGIVGPMGAAGVRTGGESGWTLRFWFEAWRVAGGDLQTSHLAINRKVSHDELQSFRASITPFAVLSVRVRIAAENASSESQALLEEILGADNTDTELRGIAAQLQQPVKHTDAVFGILLLDRRVGWHRGTTEWKGRKVELNVPVNRDTRLEEGLGTAHELRTNQNLWDQKMAECAVHQLLTLRNEVWAGQDPRMDANEFRQRLQIESITAHSDGRFRFWYDGGELFLGHQILVEGSLRTGPTEASIHG